MPKFEIHTSLLSLRDGERQAESDMIATARPRTMFSSDTRKGALYIAMESDPTITGHRDALHLVASTVRKVFYEDSSFSITASLKSAIRAANKALYQHNFNLAMQKRATVGVTCAVLKENDLFIAQVAPGQAYVLTGGQLRALPTPPSWHAAHISAAPFAQAGALGSSLFVDPELYRCMVRPGDMVALCSSTMSYRLSQQQVRQMLALEAEEAVECFCAFCQEHEVSTAHVLMLTPQVQQRSVGGAGAAEQGVVARWLARLTGQAPQAAPAEGAAGAPAAQHASVPEAPPDPLHTLPAQPELTTEPMPRPRPIDTGQSLEELHATRPPWQPSARRRSRRTSHLLADDAPLDEERPLHRPQAVDLSHLPDIEASRVTNKPPYRPRYQRRPMVDMPWYQRLLEPLRYLTAQLAELRRRPPRGEKAPSAAPAIRREATTTSNSQPPPFPWMKFLVLSLLVAVLILYGMNLSVSSSRERADSDLVLVEQRIANIWAAPSQDAALERLEQARQALDQVRNSPVITETNTAFWLRYQDLQSDYEQALAAVQRLTFLEEATVLARHPAPNGRFTSIVAPPATSAVTETDMVEALQFLYALDADRVNATLYRIPRNGGIPEPYLTSNDVVDNIEVQTLRAIDWRVDNIVAVDQGPSTAGYYFRNGAVWNHTRLGGSELWLPGSRLDIETYQGNLYVWGAEPGEILRFNSGHYGDAPMLWIDPAGLEGHDLTFSLDMAVDGNIYLLQPDGSIIVLNAGRFERQIIPEPLTPPINTPTRFFVTGPPGEGWLFLLEPLNQRVIQIDKMTGAVVQQIMIHPDNNAGSDQLTDLYVDDSGGRPQIYLINGGQLVRGEMPNPPVPFSPSTPTPEDLP